MIRIVLFLYFFLLSAYVQAQRVEDLGVVAVPNRATNKVTLHRWNQPALTYKNYKMGVVLDQEVVAKINHETQTFAKKYGYRSGPNRTYYTNRACDALCYLREYAKHSYSSVREISKHLYEEAKARNMNARDITYMALTFVQQIPYAYVYSEPFDVLAPALVAYQKKGDCDSKSLLLHMILQDLGIKSVMLTSERMQHAIIGVSIPAPGPSFTYKGDRYVYFETTAQWSIGTIPPDILRYKDWKAFSIYDKSARI